MMALNIGKMRWDGFFGDSMTYSGYRIDVVKSGIQKYIRRGILDKALFCGFEMFRMDEINAKAVVTNLFNRLKIIAVEDVGIGEYDNVIFVLDIINKNQKDASTLKSIIELLCTSRKSRVSSHLRATYQDPKRIDYARSKGINIDDAVYSEKDIKFISDHSNDSIFIDIENIDMKRCAIMFYKRLLDKDYNAIRWWGFFNYFSLQNKKKKTRVAYNNGMRDVKCNKDIVILFDVMSKFVDKNVLNVIRWSYFTMSETKPTKSNPLPHNDNSFVFLLALTAILFGVKYKGCPNYKFGISNIYNIDDLLAGNYALEIDEYVIDKHTLEGAKKGKNRNDFISEGGIIANENMIYHFPKLVDVYNH